MCGHMRNTPQLTHHRVEKSVFHFPTVARFDLVKHARYVGFARPLLAHLGNSLGELPHHRRH